MPTIKDLYIHLGPNIYVKENHIHLLCSPKDYKELEVFFSAHFNTLSYTQDEIGFPETLYKCPAGSMFVRDENGEIGEAEGNR